MRQRGASLVSLLMIVVILGGLTATAVVGVSSLTGSNNSVATALSTPAATGSTGTSGSTGPTSAIGAEVGIAAGVACNASADAARSTSTSYFAANGGQYPVKWSDLTGGSAPLYTPPAKVVINSAKPAELDGPGWKMTMTGGGATAPTFTCAT